MIIFNYFLDHIKDTQDFIGLNHYFHNRIDGWFTKNENKRTSDMGWELYPEAIYHVIVDLKKYRVPIYITENGMAVADQLEHGKVHDQVRTDFIEMHLDALAGAMRQGVNVQGYFYWSLMDNFEWNSGYAKRFGLVYVDYASQQRTLKSSGVWYRNFIAQNVLHASKVSK